MKHSSSCFDAKSLRSSSVSTIGYVELINEDGQEGVEINSYSISDSNNPKFYRYTYEETFKIVAPRWSRVEAVVESQFPPKISLKLKTKQDEECFNSNISNRVILRSQVELNNDVSQKTLIRFISKFDYIIANRYSILVKQHSISREANKFYSLLKQFSSSGNLFSQVQTGFITGNIQADNSEQSVIGFFDVSAVSTKRVFFSFTDFYPNETSVELPVECIILTPEIDNLIELLLAGEVIYYRNNECLMAPPPEDCDFSLPQGPWEVVPPVCGDCTLSGTNIKPDFWVD